MDTEILKKLIVDIKAKGWEEEKRFNVAECFRDVAVLNSEIDFDFSILTLYGAGIEQDQLIPLDKSIEEMAISKDMSINKLAFVMMGTHRVLMTLGIEVTFQEISEACKTKKKFRTKNLEQVQHETKKESSKNKANTRSL